MNETNFKFEAVIPGNHINDFHEWLAAFPAKSDVETIHWERLEDGMMQIKWHYRKVCG